MPAAGQYPPEHVHDTSVGPDEALVRPLKRVRFDFRFHIAHALGELGGPVAQKALKDLAKADLFPAVRAQAAAALERIRRRAKE